MKRAEIEEKIYNILIAEDNNDEDGYLLPIKTSKRLTALFIQLSEERCQEQIKNCVEEVNNRWFESGFMPEDIFKTPLPTLD